MTEEKKPFTVTDRRLFTSEGERRDSSESVEAEHGPGTASAPPPPRRAAPGASVPAMDFTTFLLNLAAQASLLLGQGGQPPDLEGAREMISILEMLRDKTEGRRTPDEDQVLDGVLYELRMGYLKRAGVSGA
jgi:hypothetical protein